MGGWQGVAVGEELAVYGTDAAGIRALIAERPELGERLHPALPYVAAEIVWAAREEMSRNLDDALSRRTRALLLNARAAMEIAPRVADCWRWSWAGCLAGGAGASSGAGAQYLPCTVR